MLGFGSGECLDDLRRWRNAHRLGFDNGSTDNVDDHHGTPPGGVTLGPDVLGIVRVGDAQAAAVAAMTLSTRRTRHGRDHDSPVVPELSTAQHCSALPPERHLQ
jgi:hypothetical protein